MLDLDAHCGGGTYSLVGGLPGLHHLDVAVSPHDRYAPAAPHTLDLVGYAEDYLLTIRRRLNALADRTFDLCPSPSSWPAATSATAWTRPASSPSTA